MLFLTSGFFVILIVQLPITLARFMVNDELDKLPDKWKIVSPELKPPQIELKLLKDSQDKKYTSSIEYIITYDNNIELKNGNIDKNIKENKVNIDLKKNIKDGSKNEKIKSLPSKKIIDINICPKNQKLDHLGRCREVVYFIN
ncbi:uncharacterized protein LOC116185844 [Apis dorsata]|uniref:uncharacterized protein LOC116185844 n=1 Tax=Apis dorsata TaxID=7462 RepID=UPI00129394D8|nr:uncharacterized protein LOC116185844 [Apis dorsata]